MCICVYLGNKYTLFGMKGAYLPSMCVFPRGLLGGEVHFPPRVHRFEEAVEFLSHIVVPRIMFSLSMDERPPICSTRTKDK